MKIAIYLTANRCLDLKCGRLVASIGTVSLVSYAVSCICVERLSAAFDHQGSLIGIVSAGYA